MNRSNQMLASHLRLRWFIRVVACAMASSGCTLIGAGVGAGIDHLVPGPYELHSVRERIPLTKGDRIRVKLRRGITVDGRYLRFQAPTPAALDGAMLVETDDAVVELNMSEIDRVGIEVTGRGWLYGGLIGLAVDVTVVVVAVVATSNINMSGVDLGLGK